MSRAAWWMVGSVVVVSLLAVVIFPRGAVGAAGGLAAPEYGGGFWEHWGDGQAELAGYELTYPRYGRLRSGTAVAVFVTETFAEGPRVKNETPGRPAAETFPVMKLNLMQDFATGIYDYNMMTSVFIALGDSPSARTGRPTKVSFSSQEWCGHVYAQLLFDDDVVRYQSHSYFDGEGDEQATFELPADGLAEDALLLWARGMTAPRLERGASRRVRLLRSLESSRLMHVAEAWEMATVSRAANDERLTVPAGTFDVERLEVTVEASTATRTYPPGSGSGDVRPRRWTFFVEPTPPRRLVRWERDDGLAAVLLDDTRAPYWSLNGPGLESELERLGLRARPPRTP